MNIESSHTLDDLRNRLALTTFDNPVSDPNWVTIKLLKKSSHVVEGKHTCFARIFLAGRLITLAVVSIARRETAIRLADMAQAYFWKYRIRKTRQSGAFTISREQAELDLKNEPRTVEHFRALEQFLVSNNLLPTEEGLKVRRNTPRARGEGVLTVLARIEKTQQEILSILSREN